MPSGRVVCKEGQSTSLALMLSMENDGAIFLGLSFKHETVDWAYCPMPNFAGVNTGTLPSTVEYTQHVSGVHQVWFLL